jgi:hypothetical protein
MIWKPDYQACINALYDNVILGLNPIIFKEAEIALNKRLQPQSVNCSGVRYVIGGINISVVLKTVS